MHLELFFFILHSFFSFFIPIINPINKPNIHNKITGISSFENGLNDVLSSTGFYFKSKVQQGSHKDKKMLLILGTSKNVHFWGCDFFFSSSSWLFYQLNFLVAVRIYRIHVFDEAFFLLIIRMSITTKLLTVVTCYGELSLTKMYDIPREWSCGVTWKIKCISPPAHQQ